MAGGPVLLLTTTGRKSGREHTVPLLYLEDGENLALVASNGGAPIHPAWWLNLRANPEARVEIGHRKLRVRAEKASSEEKERLWPRLVEMYGGYENYRRRTDREIPVVVLSPAGEKT
jgi:deazaflavin-dependent oxidoreductase (nitroreductase family)